MTFMSLFALVFIFLATVILPIGMGLYFAIKKRAAKPVLWGALCFLVFQVFTRIPLISYLSSYSAQWQLFSASQPFLYILLLAFTAGLFEEFGRYIIMRRFMKSPGFSDGIAFGIGHGGIEALSIAGISYLYLIITQGPANAIFTGSSTLVLWAGFERISAMVLQVGFSVMVWQSVRFKKPLYLVLAILLHAAVDFLVPLMQLSGSAVWILETIVAIFALLLLRYTIFVRKRISKNENGEVEIQ